MGRVFANAANLRVQSREDEAAVDRHTEFHGVISQLGPDRPYLLSHFPYLSVLSASNLKSSGHTPCSTHIQSLTNHVASETMPLTSEETVDVNIELRHL